MKQITGGFENKTGQKEETNLFLVLYHMIQQEQWKHEMPFNSGIAQRLNQIHHDLTFQGIQEPEYTTVIRFQTKDTIVWPTVYCTFYSYDDNGVLRKIEEVYPDCCNLPAHECLVDTMLFDENGVIVRHGPAFADKNTNYREKAPFLPIYQGAIRDGQFCYEKYALTMEDLDSDGFESRPIAKDGSEPWWFNYVPKAGDRRTLDYWFGNPVFPKIYKDTELYFHVVKCSPKFEEQLKEHLQEPTDMEIQVLTGVCGRDLSWKQVNDVLYIAGQGEIEDYAFCGDSSIRKVVIATGCTEIGESTFAYCDQLQEVELPEGLLRIGKEAFSGCSVLAVITLPNGLQEIGEEAFWFCNHKDLKLHIPDTVTEIGEDAFGFVPEIDYFGPAWDEWNWGAKKWVNIHDTCDSGSWKIKDNTLYVYVNGELPLKEFEVRSIHHRFSETEIRSPWDSYNDRFEHVFIAPGCTKIPRDSFCYCRNLKTISIPDTVKGIEEYAFYGCKRLTSIEIPDSVTEIGDNAFEDIPCIIYNGPAQSDDNWGAKSWN